MRKAKYKRYDGVTREFPIGTVEGLDPIMVDGKKLKNGGWTKVADIDDDAADVVNETRAKTTKAKSKTKKKATKAKAATAPKTTKKDEEVDDADGGEDEDADLFDEDDDLDQ